MGQFGRKGLPRAIPAEELQTMLGNSRALCSRHAVTSATCELITRWRFLFSHARSTGLKSQPQQKSR
jgi:hypothetical protein